MMDIRKFFVRSSEAKRQKLQECGESFPSACTAVVVSTPFEDAKTIAVAEPPLVKQSAAETPLTSIASYSSPNQPSTSAGIPTQQLSNRILRFQPSWFQRFPWLHLAPNVNGVLCFTCVKASNQNLLGLASKSEDTFISTGFTNWKRGVEKFLKHEKSSTHALAIHQLQQQKSKPIIAQLSDKKQQEQACYRIGLMKLLSSLRYLARQGLALRGHESSEGNYQQLLNLRSEDMPELKSLLHQTTNFTSPDCQNEMLNLLSHKVLRQIVSEIKEAKQFAVIMDGTEDVSGTEQESICVRYVDASLQIHETFLGLFQPPDTTGATLAAVTLDALLRLGLSAENLRAQTYDGASNMSGCYHGCQVKVREKHPLALFFHCGGHCANLVAQSTASTSPLLRDAIQRAHDLGVLYRRSGKFKKMFEEVSDGTQTSFTTLKPLCPTRWLVRHKAITAILSQYEAVVDSLEEMAQASCGDTSTTANGLLDCFQKGTTVLGLFIAQRIFGLLECLNEMVQAEKQTLSGMLEAIATVQRQLHILRSDDEFQKLFQQAQDIVSQLDLEPIVLPRKRRPPQRYSGAAPAHYAETAAEHYQPMYFMALDHASAELGRRFDTYGISIYKKLESMLLEGVVSVDIAQRYPELDVERLKIQLAMFKSQYAPKSLQNAKSIMQKMVPEVRILFSQVEELLRLLLVCPVTSCEAERSFSSLRRLKTWLRTSMTQTRLNAVAICHAHQDYVDAVNLEELAQEFVERSQIRKGVFGSFM